MTLEHPFQQLFETFGKHSAAHAELVNREAREKLRKQLEGVVGGAGACVLLKAPRAGYGKTHLLNRLQHDLGGTHEFFPLHAVGGCRIDALTVTDNVLCRLVRPLSAAGGLTVFDLVGRRLLAAALQPLVRAGEVPCEDREGALSALAERPIETFDFQHPAAVMAHWTRANFEVLGPRLATELSNQTGIALKEVSFWLEVMFRYAVMPPSYGGRVRAMFGTVFQSGGEDFSHHERLGGLLGLLCTLMKVVLVADELEGFFTDEPAALKFASFVISLRQEVESLQVVISLNEDVWQNAFVPRLSCGLFDRLSETVIELEALDQEGVLAMLESRLPGQGERLLQEMASGTVPDYSRALIMEAGKVLGRMTDRDVVVLLSNELKPVGNSLEIEQKASVFEKAPVQENMKTENALPPSWPLPDVGQISSGLDVSPGVSKSLSDIKR